MSVIITNREIPKGCLGCDYIKFIINDEIDICKLTDARFKNSTASYVNRQDNCPLKSVEGLIEEVNNMCDDADVFTLTTEFMNNRISMEDFIDAVGEFYRKEVAEIIKGYCEVSK